MKTDENQDETDGSWRDDPEWQRDRFPAWDSDESALRAARTEARESLEETITAIQRLDDAAMTTLRIDLMIIGLSLTAVSSFQSSVLLINELTVFGFLAVGLSTLVAIVATLGFGYPTGVSEEYTKEFQQASWSEREWNEWMVREYSEWLSETRQTANGGTRLLFCTKALLGVGLLLLALGIAMGVAGVLDPVAGVQLATGT